MFGNGRRRVVMAGFPSGEKVIIKKSFDAVPSFPPPAAAPLLLVC